MTLPELLSDPVRARIYLEVLLNEEVTAQQLMDIIKISRSTMSHHLSRFVEDKVLKVRVQETGRSVKFYSHNPDFKEELVIEGKDRLTLQKRIMFLESASAHLHVISSLLQERSRKIRETHTKPKRKTTVSFIFSFMSKEEAAIWDEEYDAFQKRFDERRKVLKNSSDSLDYIGYGGLTPTR
jgi:DNA-binding transcriptional ArsR family regulator